MSFAKFLKKTIYSACLYFTAAEFFILLMATAFSDMEPQNGGTAGMFLGLGSAALIFAACFIMALLNAVWRLEYSTPIKILIHFIGTLIAYSLLFIIIPGVGTNVAQVIARLVVLLVLYFIVAFIILIVNSVKKNRRTEQLEYESQFGDFMDGN